LAEIAGERTRFCVQPETDDHCTVITRLFLLQVLVAVRTAASGLSEWTGNGETKAAYELRNCPFLKDDLSANPIVR